MAKYLSNRVRNFNIGVSGITESDTVLTTIGNSTFTGAVYLKNYNKLKFGVSESTPDLEIYHDSSRDSFIDSNTKSLFIRNNVDNDGTRGNIVLQAKSGDDSAKFVDGGGVELYYDNSKKFETTSTGIEVSGNVALTGEIHGPATLTIDPAAVGDNTGTVVIAGDLQIDGTTTTVNSTTMTVDDKNLELGTGAANDAAADGGGITIVSGDGNKTFNFEATGDNLGSSENLNLASGKEYKINNTSVLSATTLGTGVTGSSLTSVGILSSLTSEGTIKFQTTASSAGQTAFLVQDGSASPTDVFRIYENGETVIRNTAYFGPTGSQSTISPNGSSIFLGDMSIRDGSTTNIFLNNNGDATFKGDITIADKIIHDGDTDTAIRFPASDTVTVETAGSERLRIASAGQLGLGGANYGTSGQVITSNGTGSAPTWQDISSTTITVADESTDTTCFPLFATNATGSISPKTGSNFEFNSNTGTLKLTSAGNAIRINNTLVDIVDIGNDNGAFAINAGGNVNTMIVKSGGTERLQINSSGAEVTGVMTATTFSGSGSSLTDLTGASAATYGDGSNVAQIVVDATGRITGISNVAISGGGGGGGVTVQDEGNPLSTTATTLNFVGSGVVASGTGATKTITISGEGVSSVTAADESSDTTCFPLFATSATGSVAAKTDASGLKYDSSNERLETTDVAVKGSVRYENSGSTERFEILYNETTDSLDFTYSAS